MSPKGIYEQTIKPNFHVIRDMLSAGKTEANICKELNVNILVWRSCKRHFSDFVRLIEESSDNRSNYYTKVLPFIDRIEGYLLEGITEHQIAKLLDIFPDDFTLYKKVYPEFGEFVFKCKEAVDCVVEHAMFKAAKGYTYEEKKESIEEGEVIYNKEGDVIYQTNSDGTFKLKDGKKIPKRKHGKVKVERTKKEYAPNVAAGQFWLSNRKRNEWAIRSDSNHFVNAGEAARAIKESLADMEETIPKIPDQTPFETITSNITDLSPEELEKLKDTLEFISSKKK